MCRRNSGILLLAALGDGSLFVSRYQQFDATTDRQRQVMILGVFGVREHAPGDGPAFSRCEALPVWRLPLGGGNLLHTTQSRYNAST